MKEITVLSGKGGTGKTSITAALASLTMDSVFCDNDVEASDLHLILKPEIREENIFYGGWTPKINKDLCTQCGICIDHCRFDAIRSGPEGNLIIDRYGCEGCRLCDRLCPAGAVLSERNGTSKWFVSETRFGTLIHAKMGAGEENSGKLVTAVRKKAREIGEKNKAEYVINDGPPGIGCPTIASLSGADLVLIVIEPTKSGLHDVRRLTELIRSFDIPAYAIINKYNINSKVSEEIQNFLKAKAIEVLARIPFDREMVDAMIAGQTIYEYNPDNIISKKIYKTWQRMRA
ncbi:MAG: ATP-binding protein [Bacteroidales bacterium]|jgi:MinD superfamily P-loop ATPase